jgi:hypothetical protein
MQVGASRLYLQILAELAKSMQRRSDSTHSARQQMLMLPCRCKQAEILAGVCGQREALERRVYEQDVQLELSLDELETAVQVST